MFVFISQDINKSCDGHVNVHMLTMKCSLESPVISVPGRMNYFPPIASPATMYQRRKKKSARELYHLCPHNHDLIIQNPPVTPWDEPPEFFRNFIGTPEENEQNGGADLKSTWPFLRQIGPKCVFKKMRKKIKEEGNPFDTHKAAGSFSASFLEPECIGLAPTLSGPRVHFFSAQYAGLQNVNTGRHIESAHFRDTSANLRLESATRNVKAPPPSETRSAKSDDGLSDNQRLFASPDNVGKIQRALRVNDSKATTEAVSSKYNQSARARFLRFEQSDKLPDKLQHLPVFTPDSIENAEMYKLTWHDIVQARFTRKRTCADDATSASGCKNDKKGMVEDAHVSWKLPKTKHGLSAPDKARHRERRGAEKLSDLYISSWIDDVRRAQTYDRFSTSR